MKTLNKKSTVSLEMTLWIPRLIFLVVVIFSIYLLIKLFITNKIDTFDVETSLFANSILFSKSLNFFDGDTNRINIGTIDLQKFESENTWQKLESEIGYSNDKKIAARISLKNLDNGMNYNDVFYRKDFYEQKKVIADAGFTKGPGGAKSSTKNFYVLIKDKDSISKGLSTIDVVMPNS